MNTKFLLFLFLIVNISCAKVGDNTYGFWFDPRAQEIKEKEKLEAQARAEAWEVIKKNQELESERIKINIEKDAEKLAKENAEKAWLELERKRQEDEFIKNNELALKEKINKENEEKKCIDFKKINCKYIIKKITTLIQKCKFVNQTKLCWDENTYSTKNIFVCSKELPNGCYE